jgi:hypothetical protein
MNTKQERDDGSELLSRWFFGELAFVLLPLAVIGVVRCFLGVKLGDIFVLPEWSFAAIILLAVGMNRFLLLKTRVQRDESNKVFHGARFVVILLLIAAVTLAFSVAAQQGVKIDQIVLSVSQVALVVLAAGFLYLAIAHEIRHENEARDLPASLAPDRTASLIRRDVKDVEATLRRIDWAMARVDSRSHFSPSSSMKYCSVSNTLEDISISCQRILRYAEKIDRSVGKAAALKAVGNVSDITEAGAAKS